MQETAETLSGPESLPHNQEPIVLNPGLADSKEKIISKNSRGVFSTLGILLAGWFFGNLILLTLVSAGLAIAAGSTGLVKIPVVTQKFFGMSATNQGDIDEQALENAEEKLKNISGLRSGETLKSVALDESELNALLQKQIETAGNFKLTNTKIKLTEDHFSLSGNLKETNAPVELVGKVEVSGLVANIEIVSAKFGKVEIPSFIATNLFENYLSDIGLSLSGSQIPAKSIKIAEGLVSLIEVSNDSD